MAGAVGFRMSYALDSRAILGMTIVLEVGWLYIVYELRTVSSPLEVGAAIY
jgi:hypothetical protein